MVRSAASGSKCYQLLPDNENTAFVNVVSENCASVDGRKVMIYASCTQQL